MPITNNNNLEKAISCSKSSLRVQLYRESDAELMYQRVGKQKQSSQLQISAPKEFRQVHIGGTTVSSDRYTLGVPQLLHFLNS